MPVEAVGAYLREQRERRGISLDEVSRLTRVPTRYLEALEASRFEELPAPVFVRGFVRAYCQALGEPPEHALARLPSGEETGPPRGRIPEPARVRTARPAAETPAAAARSRARPAVAVSLVLLVVLGVALVSLTTVVRPPDQRRAADLPTGPAASEVEQASPRPPVAADVPSLVALEDAPAGSVAAAPPPRAPAAPTAAVAPAPPPPAPAPAATPVPVAATTTPGAAPSPEGAPSNGARRGAEAAYRLVARTTEPTWIRVRTGDGRTIEETMPAGAVREWASNRPFELTIGNAGGILLELNGTALPPLGASGAVISRLVVPAAPR